MVAAATVIPSTQKAQVTREFGLDPKFEEISVPEPKDDELLVHVLYSGVCHTDVGVVKNEYVALGLGLPIIAGHEGAGIVVKVGKSVSGFQTGDRVGCAYLHRTCNNCEHCKQQGNEAFCYSAEYLATHKNWGTFQQYIAVPAIHAHRIPDKLDLPKAAPILCAGVTVYRALKETGARPGQFVSITGAGGGLGSLALQYSKALGLRPIAIDFGDTKKDHCYKQGAEFFVDAKTQDVVQEVRRVTDGKGPHAVVNIAPAIKPIEDALKYTRKNGVIVLAGLPEGGFKVEVLPFVFDGLKIKASFLGSRQDMDEALDFMARGLVDIPIEILPLSELPTALKRLDACQVNGRLVLDNSK